MNGKQTLGPPNRPVSLTASVKAIFSEAFTETLCTAVYFQCFTENAVSSILFSVKGSLKL